MTTALSAKDELAAEAIFLGEPSREIAKRLGVCYQAVDKWASGQDRPGIRQRVDELKTAFAKRNEARLMQVKSECLDVIVAGLRATKMIKTLKRRSDYQEVPDHEVRLRAAGLIRQQFVTAEEAEEIAESTLTLFHRAEQRIKGNGHGGNGG
jgi:hypothetical protein